MNFKYILAAVLWIKSNSVNNFRKFWKNLLSWLRFKVNNLKKDAAGFLRSLKNTTRIYRFKFRKPKERNLS